MTDPVRQDGFMNNGISLTDERIVALWAQTPEPVTFARAVLAAALEPGRADEHRHGATTDRAALAAELRFVARGTNNLTLRERLACENGADALGEADTRRLDWLEKAMNSLWVCTHQKRSPLTDGSGGHQESCVFDGWSVGLGGEERPTAREAIDAAMPASAPGSGAEGV